MKLLEYFGFSSKKEEPKEQTIPVHIPIPAEQVESVKEGMKYVYEWFCTSCVSEEFPNGRRLRITSRTDRAEGPSNFKGVYPEGYPNEKKRGHSIVPSGYLNWNGLAEERGWIVEPDVICPVCQGKK